jgi:hypothetical protein
VSFLRAPSQGRLNIRVGSGDTEVRLPAGTSLSTEFRSGVGSQHSDFAADPRGGRFQLSVLAGSGNLSVKKITP